MDPNLLLTVNVPALSQAAGALPPEVIDVARLFDGQRVVAEVLDESHLSPRMTVAVVGRLWRLGLLNPLAPPPEAAPELRWAAVPVEPPAPGPAATPAPIPADDPLARALALAETLELGVVAAASPALEATNPEVRAPALDLADTVVFVTAPPAPSAPTTAVAGPGFDDTDERFFDSYQPEPLPDDFVDLEDRPYSRRIAARRRRQGSWVSSFIGRLNSLLP